jgi:hypothetical protein
VACGDVAAEDGDVVVEVGGTGGKGFVVALDGGGEVAFAEERVGGDLFRGCFSEEGLATSEGYFGEDSGVQGTASSSGEKRVEEGSSSASGLRVLRAFWGSVSEGGSMLGLFVVGNSWSYRELQGLLKCVACALQLKEME